MIMDTETTETRTGYRYLVRLRVSSQRWYPSQGGSEDKASPTTRTLEYDLICGDRGLPACHAKVEELLTQDYGRPGVHDGVGVKWCYVVDEVSYKGEVRL